MQGELMKYCCFLCQWNSHATAGHYIRCVGKQRTKYEPGVSSVQCDPLVDPKNIFLLPLHIKFGLKKKVKAMGKVNSRVFQYRVQ